MTAAICAMDPGLRTGFALWTPDSFTALITDPEDSWDVLDRWTNTHGGTGQSLLIVERYTITPETAKKSRQEWSLELIGVARFLAAQRRITYGLQTPAEAKSYCPDARLRQLGMWSPGKEDHHRDATRHLVRALARRRLIQVPPLEG